jgi:hypothetical protein
MAVRLTKSKVERNRQADRTLLKALPMTSADIHEVAAAAETAAIEVSEEPVASTDKQQLLEAKVVELTASNHKLRVENLALRSRIERQKLSRSLERKLHVTLSLSLWLLSMVAVGVVVIISSGR